MKKESVAIGCDHAGFHLKEAVIKKLNNLGFLVHDFGAFSDASVDYPDYIHPAASKIDSGEISRGVFICGSGQGVTMTANKYQNVRAALCWKVDLAKVTRQHNNSNVLCIPGRFVSKKMALNMVEAFFSTEFEGGRHERRVNKIACC